MCEPTHSITQFPSDGDNDNMINPSGTGWGIGKVLEWGKKVLGYLHYSRVGSGHSESLSLIRSEFLPDDTKYEAFWWHRKVRLDGYFKGKEGERELALEAATVYANRVSIGNIGMLRRFLEASLRKTDSPGGYVSRFRDDMLNPKGREEFDRQWKRIFNKKIEIDRRLKTCLFAQNGLPSSTKLESLIRFMMGFTRKSWCLIDEWASSRSGEGLVRSQGTIPSTAMPS